MKLYHDAIKQLNPDVLFEAVLQPYHFQWAVVHRDDEALYLLAEMSDRPDNKPAAAERPRDDALFEDDCFEVFLAPEQEAGPSFHFAISAAGSVYDAQNPAPGKHWDGQWQAGAARRSGGWTAELQIPFATIGRAPAAGDAWWINLGRHRAPSARDPRAETSNVIGSPSHHDRAAYRKLVFVDVVKGDLTVVVAATAADGSLDARQTFAIDSKGRAGPASGDR